jgi:hypothetical protein
VSSRMKSNTLITILQIIGVLLCSSSAAGEELLERWQSAVRAYFNIGLYISRLSNKMLPVIEVSFRVLYLPAVILTLGVIVYRYIYFVWDQLFDLLSGRHLARIRSRYGESFPMWLYWIDMLAPGRSHLGGGVFHLFLFLCFLLISIIRLIVASDPSGLAGLFLFEEIIKPFGKGLAYMLSGIIYGGLLVLCIMLYTGTVILLSPYLLAEKISIRLKSRRTLVVLGTMVNLVALLIRLFS